MPTTGMIRALLSQASTTGARSTALQPLTWLMGILISGLFVALKWNAPSWVLISVVVMLGLCTACFVFSYGYFMFRNPDALRSESFSLSKMAIEKNLMGDNSAGLIEVAEFGEMKAPKVLPGKQVTKE